MPELRETRRKLRIAVTALAAVDVLLLVVLFSPLVGSEQSRKQQKEALWRQLQSKNREVAPLRGLDKKVAIASQQIGEFYKGRLPAQISGLYAEFGKLASQNGVKIFQARYKEEDPEPNGLRPLTIEADLSGDYLQLVRFINALERDQMFFNVNSVTLGGEQNGPVKLQMKLETYLRTGA
jgi:type IV pilus assembly protein PilO